MFDNNYFEEFEKKCRQKLPGLPSVVQALLAIAKIEDDLVVEDEREGLGDLDKRRQNVGDCLPTLGSA